MKRRGFITLLGGAAAWPLERRFVVERGLPHACVEGLRARPRGGIGAIAVGRAGDPHRLGAGVLIGGSDPRKDGCALGY